MYKKRFFFLSNVPYNVPNVPIDITFIKSMDFELNFVNCQKNKRMPLVFKEFYVGNHNKFFRKSIKTLYRCA